MNRMCNCGRQPSYGNQGSWKNATIWPHNAFALQCSHLLDCCNPPASTSTIVNSAWHPTPPPFSPSVKFPARQKSGPEISKHASKNSRNVRWTPKIDTPLSKLFSVQWPLVRTLFLLTLLFSKALVKTADAENILMLPRTKMTWTIT